MDVFGSDYCETANGLECAECWAFYHELVSRDFGLLFFLRGEWRRA